MRHVWTPYCTTCDKEEQRCERGLLMLYRSCCSSFLLLLRAVPLHLDRSEVAYFTKGTNGEPAVLPGVLIVLHGPVTKETESDAKGAFAVDGIPAGGLSDRSECSRLICGTRGGSQRRHIFYRFSRNECGSGQQHH